VSLFNNLILKRRYPKIKEAKWRTLCGDTIGVVLFF
jgi:hypothetical protein